MKIECAKIFLSAHFNEASAEQTDAGSTGVIVVLPGGEKWYAAFFSFSRINQLRKAHRASGEFLKGKYFWNKHLVMVENCEKETIEQVVRHLMEQGEFREAFLKL